MWIGDEQNLVPKTFEMRADDDKWINVSCATNCYQNHLHNGMPFECLFTAAAFENSYNIKTSLFKAIN
jgi:hypothetical protein